MHGRGKNRRVTLGYVPISSSMTGRYTTPGGSLFSLTHPIVHAEQPTHFRRSITITQRRWSTGFFSARFRSSCIRKSGSSGVPTGALATMKLSGVFSVVNGIPVLLI
jgi:hypothetical protein